MTVNRDADVETSAPVSVTLTSTVLVIAILSFSLTQGMVIPAIPTIARNFHTTVASATWAISGNLALTAVSTPLAGRLGDIFGRKRVLLITLSLFMAGGLLAAFATDFGLFVAGRVLQGAGGGVFALGFAVARELVPPGRFARVVSVQSTATMIGGAGGIPLGGLVMDIAGYRAVFWIGSVMAAVALIGVLLVLPANGQRESARIDWTGVVLLSIGVTVPLVAISRVSSQGWLALPTIVAIIVGILTFALFIIVERRTRAPFLDFATLRMPPIAVANIASFLIGLTNFAVMVTVPELGQAATRDGGLGLGAAASSVLLVPGSAALVVMAYLVGKVVARSGDRIPYVVGALITVIGMASLTLLPFDWVWLAMGSLAAFVGITFSLTALTHVVVSVAPAAQTGEATGVFILVRIAGSAVGVQLAASILAAHATPDGLSGRDGYVITFATFGVIAAAYLVAGLAVPKNAAPAVAARITPATV